ncbi:hypothetical protein Kpol_1024p26 [Vanderwaltozyma polyspora DSM 70294]|uniref:SHSP domain-containing protein n=1 Tax=Vanderwaltozyma polyspora (strain ATCC 22028 / DSM 70294 / BCRC 21397 / CBS 2163 / NBRC 10782 / NRRL Y-8283 / UCD 57-17) TaxID=436907 RepID=A7TLI6_VANPO|nr:uncharacterized protein Kpol_1024p26 [Vanderwaltozyma polyspora DSM 70294]EDO16872.1 hypothetical protein Kpol_1024p26 [Vanderwaltozyma polyspora DSM 70294]
MFYQEIPPFYLVDMGVSYNNLSRNQINNQAFPLYDEYLQLLLLSRHRYVTSSRSHSFKIRPKLQIKHFVYNNRDNQGNSYKQSETKDSFSDSQDISFGEEVETTIVKDDLVDEGENAIVNVEPFTNIYEYCDKFVIHLVAPGIISDKFCVDYLTSTKSLRIKAKCDPEYSLDEENTIVKEANINDFEKTIKLSTVNQIDTSNISATYRQGILKITVFKNNEKPAIL